MLKTPISVKSTEGQAIALVSDVLGQISPLKISKPRLARLADLGVDGVLIAEIDGRRFELLVEFKSVAQPRHVRNALLQLRHVATQVGKNAVPLLVAPFLSHEARVLCREFDVGFVDFEGNARVSFGTVFLERSVSSRPIAHQRELKSLYKPKAALILRALLEDPGRVWLTTELANVAGVSLGHVSNVRNALLEREWAQVTPRGLALIAPGALLDDWRRFYDPRHGTRLSFYTPLHGAELEAAARRAIRMERKADCPLLFSSFSAAEWLAPYARVSLMTFVAENEAAVSVLRDEMKLQQASRGENVVVTVPRDSGVFKWPVEPAEDVLCTSVIQTYLDLASSGERGQEAAEHLRKQRLKW